MSNSNFPQPTGTKPHPASNVSPLHHSGSTTMSGLRPFQAEAMDHWVFRTYSNLRELNLCVLEMVTALNVALRQYGWVIATVADLDCFIEAAEEWEAEND
ncbi:hypothetical protein NF212_25355 (plasmid) [Parasalinivibrio latis]|uniref:hypothetical protein n=1 Tax=Parasalinivibrio latis TaxID=2952610 RepID=UPI0030E48CB6